MYRWRIAAAWCTMADVQIVLAMTLHLFYLFKKNFKNYFTSNSQLYKILEESHLELSLFISVQIFTSYYAWQLANWEMVNKSTPFLKPFWNLRHSFFLKNPYKIHFGCSHKCTSILIYPPFHFLAKFGKAWVSERTVFSSHLKCYLQKWLSFSKSDCWDNKNAKT